MTFHSCICLLLHFSCQRKVSIKLSPGPRLSNRPGTLRHSYSECSFNTQLIIVCFTSSPNPPDSGRAELTWPKFTETKREYLVLDLKPRVERSYKADKVAFWNKIVPKLFKQTSKKENETKPVKDEL